MAEIIVKLGDQIIQKYPIRKDRVTIGRARDNEVVVENLSVSRNHARITFEDGKYVLSDLNSANGSFLNGVKVTTADLQDNDIISIGKHKLHFSIEAEELEELAAERAKAEPEPEPEPVEPAAEPGVPPSFDDWAISSSPAASNPTSCSVSNWKRQASAGRTKMTFGCTIGSCRSGMP